MAKRKGKGITKLNICKKRFKMQDGIPVTDDEGETVSYFRKVGELVIFGKVPDSTLDKLVEMGIRVDLNHESDSFAVFPPYEDEDWAKEKG